MTPELQRVRARYEEARVQYKKAVLASLNGSSNGDAIREAIRKVQAASAELKRLQPSSPTLPPMPQNQNETVASPSWGFFTKLLKAG
jgi:hypothetical protein